MKPLSQSLYLTSPDVQHMQPLTPIRTIERSLGIAVRTCGVKFMIRMNEILRCEADSNYCFIHTSEGRKVIVAKTLKSVSHALPSGFFRVHHAHVVRLDAIHQVHDVHVTLVNGDHIPISRRNKKGLIQKLAGTATFQ